jgi:8-oxo-dGTP diphosphatase
VERRRRIGAYGLTRDDLGRVLLVRASSRSVRPGTWLLPGGGIDHGEDPAEAVVREMTEETGLAVEVDRVRDVVAEVVTRAPWLEHTGGVVFDVSVAGGVLRPELDGSSDRARWVPPAEVMELPLSALAAHVLGVGEGLQTRVDPTGPTAARGPEPRPARGQRFAAYGLVTDPDDRVLLTLISDGYPSAGQWHLPGGGTEFGEQPAAGLVREITEESGQRGEITGLLTVASHHNRAALGPEGYPIDWHSVRAVFGVAVPEPTTPRVLDAGGSTAKAGWFRRTEAAALPLTDIASRFLGPR